MVWEIETVTETHFGRPWTEAEISRWRSEGTLVENIARALEEEKQGLRTSAEDRTRRVYRVAGYEFDSLADAERYRDRLVRANAVESIINAPANPLRFTRITRAVVHDGNEETIIQPNQITYSDFSFTPEDLAAATPYRSTEEERDRWMNILRQRYNTIASSIENGLVQGNSPTMNEPWQKPKPCKACQHYYGKTHYGREGSNRLICAMHPYGPEGEECEDREVAPEVERLMEAIGGDRHASDADSQPVNLQAPRGSDADLPRSVMRNGPPFEGIDLEGITADYCYQPSESAILFEFQWIDSVCQHRRYSQLVSVSDIAVAANPEQQRELIQSVVDAAKSYFRIHGYGAGDRPDEQSSDPVVTTVGYAFMYRGNGYCYETRAEAYRKLTDLSIRDQSTPFATEWTNVNVQYARVVTQDRQLIEFTPLPEPDRLMEHRMSTAIAEEEFGRDWADPLGIVRSLLMGLKISLAVLSEIAFSVSEWIAAIGRWLRDKGDDLL